MTPFRSRRLYFALPLGLCLMPPQQRAAAQSEVSLSGTITDPSGALVPNAHISLHCPSVERDATSTSSPLGRYTFTSHSASGCTVFVSSPGFESFQSLPLEGASGRIRILDIHLKLQNQADEVSVSDESGLDTDPNRNGTAIILRGRDIDNLPLNSAELLQELQGLSGGPQPDFYVDGFSGGSLPSRDTIREIRINQNPYSAQNDTNPANGQVQVFTKPGTNKLHGDLYTFGNDSAFNTRNPFVTQQPSYYSFGNYASLSGPINKHASYFLNGGNQTSQTNSFINAQVLDTSNNPVAFIQAVPAPSSGYNFSPRLDFAAGKKSTLIARYTYSSLSTTNGGIGGFSLPSQAFSSTTQSQTLQVSNSQILTPKIVNDTRFQYIRTRTRQIPVSTAPTIAVAGAFTDGGNPLGSFNDNQDRFELQNYVSASAGKQFFTFGGRFRALREANRSSANYNATYTFASLAQYQLARQGLPGGAPSQFTMTSGNPSVAISVNDTALFFQDDWRARPGLTLSGGLRFESQTAIADHADWAPRLGLAWGLKTRKDKPALYMLRLGAGLFYNRFVASNLLQAARQDGIRQQQFVVNAPGFYPYIPTAADLGVALAPSAIYQISPVFHAPYYFSSTVSLERQIKSWGSVTVTYLHNRGLHSQLTRNINAPLPGTYNVAQPNSGVRPRGGNQNIYEYDSGGVYTSNRLSTNFFLRIHGRFMIYGYYMLRHDTTDASGGGFPSNQYNLAADFGRSPNDIRHSAYIGSSIQLPFGFESYYFIRASSGAPFNITVGQDLNGDSIFNDRPAFATDLSRPSVVRTALGNFDTSPIDGQAIVPINAGHGPGQFAVNLNLNRDIPFGPRINPPAGAPAAKLAPGQKAPHIARRYSVNFAIDAQNLFNQVNLAPPVGVVGSPLFGRYTALAGTGGSPSANRVIQLESYFHF